jgi:hypothetical protein
VDKPGTLIRLRLSRADRARHRRDDIEIIACRCSAWPPAGSRR